MHAGDFLGAQYWRWVGMILSKGTHVNEEGEVRRIGGDYESEEEIIRDMIQKVQSLT